MTTKTQSDAALRKVLASVAAERDLDAEGVMALVQAGARRHLLAETRAEVRQIATAVYDGCFGPGAFTTDARSQ